jgi:hypothetical protein
MAKWTAFPHAGDYQFDAGSVRRHWARLHAGDAEPCPGRPLLEAWALFHNGEFQKAMPSRPEAGLSGITLANKATCIYATYLEKRKRPAWTCSCEVAERAEAQASPGPEERQRLVLACLCTGPLQPGHQRGQGAGAGAGQGSRTSLERSHRPAARHADAHIALGAFHAEVIDKVGSLIGGMTYGARRTWA